MKDSGVERKPMRNARLKFRVERVARNMPRRRKEMHWMRMRCCGVGSVRRESRIARRVGKRMFAKVKRKRVWCVDWIGFIRTPAQGEVTK